MPPILTYTILPHPFHLVCYHLYLDTDLIVRVCLVFRYMCRLHAALFTHGCEARLSLSWTSEGQCRGQRTWLPFLFLFLQFLYLVLPKHRFVRNDSISVCTIPWNKTSTYSMASEGQMPSKALYQTALGLRLFFSVFWAIFYLVSLCRFLLATLRFTTQTVL